MESVLDATVVVIVTKSSTSLGPTLSSCLEINPHKVVIADPFYNPRMVRYHTCPHLSALKKKLGDRLSYSAYAPKFDEGRPIVYVVAGCSLAKETLQDAISDINLEHISISTSNYMPVHKVESQRGAWMLNGVILIYFIIQWLRSFFWRFRVDKLPHKSHVTVEKLCSISKAEQIAWKAVLSQRGFLDATVTRMFGSGYGVEPKNSVLGGVSGIVHHHRKCRGGMAQLSEFMDGCHPLGIASTFFSFLALVFWTFSGLSVLLTPFATMGPILALYLSASLCIFMIGFKHLKMKGLPLFSLLYPLYSLLLLFMWPYCTFANKFSNKGEAISRSGLSIAGEMDNIQEVSLKKFRESGCKSS
jgi:hypothetical protein